MTPLVRRHRIRLDEALRDLGRAAEAGERFDCACCGSPAIPAGLLVDVRDREDDFGAQFVCVPCAADLIRRETAEFEALERDRLAAEGKVDEETLNGLRAMRDARLLRSDWTESTRSRDRIGEARAAAWDAYRLAVHAVVDTARDTGVVEDFPDPPE